MPGSERVATGMRGGCDLRSGGCPVGVGGEKDRGRTGVDEQFETGLARRKKVLGEAHVAKSFAEADDFTKVLQDFVTRNAWGTVWLREGLDPKIRSLVTVAMLIALGRPKELGSHVRGAINNGATEAELREVLLHATVYCGFPLAIDAYNTAAAELRALKKAR